MSVENVLQLESIINAWPSRRVHYLSHDSKNCCAKFRFIVPPQNTISSGKFSALGPCGTAGWTRIITGNPTGQDWEVLARGRKVLSYELIGQLQRRCCFFIGSSRHQSVDSQVPLKFKTFFYEEEEESSYKQTLVTDLHGSPGENTQ